MIALRKSIPRRTVLRGLGASLALPLLDGMIPALTARAQTAAAPVHRFGVVYVPNGMVMENYTPATEGPSFELSPTLQALAPFRAQTTVVSGLDCIPSPGRPGGAHAKASTRYLTDISPPTSETWLDAGISVDQILATHLGSQTQLASLEQFDALGQWRVATGAGPIDASASLPDGSTFDGARGLRAFLASHREDFVRTFTEKLLAYALGRGLEPADMPAVRRIVRDASSSGHRWSSIVDGIVTSVPFQFASSERAGS